MLPSVVNTQTSFSATDAASQTITLPGSIVAGNLLVAICAVDGSRNATLAMTGWTLVAKAQGLFTTLVATLGVFTKTAVAGEANPTLTIGAAENHASVVYQVSDWSGTLADVVGTIDTSSTTTPPDPPALTPAAGLQDYLWLAIAAGANGPIATGGPTGFSAVIGVASGTAAANVSIQTAYLAQANTTMDPSVFTGGTFVDANYGIPATVAIRGAATVAPKRLFLPF